MKKLKQYLHAVDKEISAVLAVLIALVIDNADSVMQAAVDHLPELATYLSATAVRWVAVLAFTLKIVLAARKARSKGAA